GLALAAMVARPRWLAGVLTGGLLVAAVAGGVASSGGVDAGQTVAEARVNLASPDRTGALHAALGLVAQHPLTGTGPGQADLRWKGPDHGAQLYAYVQTESSQVQRNPVSGAWSCSQSCWPRSRACCGARAPPAAQ